MGTRKFNSRYSTNKNKYIHYSSSTLSKSGFTLIEIMLVIVIVGLLFIFLIPKIANSTTQAKETAIKNDFKAYETAADIALRENAGITSKAEVLALLNSNLDEVYQVNSDDTSNKTDPWNNVYKVDIMGESEGSANGAIVITSAGLDGIIGSEDDYSTTITYIDGETDISTKGFSSNIESETDVASSFESLTGEYVGHLVTSSSSNSSSGSPSSSGSINGTNSSGTNIDAEDEFANLVETNEDYFEWDDSHTIIYGFSDACPPEAKVNVVIPSSCTTIEHAAFDTCGSLVSVVIPDTVKSIGAYAFEECDKLEEVRLPEGLKSIPDGIFNNCIILKKVNIPSSVTAIGYESFYNCGFTSFDVPSNITSIDRWAFGCCEKLESVNIPSSVKTIGTYAFENCESLEEVSLSYGLESIGKGAFSGCTSITTATWCGENSEWNNVSVASGNECLTSKIKCTMYDSYPGDNIDSIVNGGADAGIGSAGIGAIGSDVLLGL